MARKVRKFGDGGDTRYDRKLKDIESDYAKAMGRKTGRAAEVAKAKYEQRMADAKDDLAKRTGIDRTTTRAAEKAAERNLTTTRRYGASSAGKALGNDAPLAPAVNVDVSKLTGRGNQAVSDSRTFASAFREARKAGSQPFTWRGKSYSTALASEAKPNAPVMTKANVPAPKPNAPVMTKANVPASKASPGSLLMDRPEHAAARHRAPGKFSQLASSYGEVVSANRAKTDALVAKNKAEQIAREKAREKAHMPLPKATDGDWARALAARRDPNFAEIAPLGDGDMRAKGGKVKAKGYAKGGSVYPVRIDFKDVPKKPQNRPAKPATQSDLDRHSRMQGEESRGDSKVMKRAKGGTVHGDGCCVKGKTKGRMR